jgi:alpha-glucosidase
MSWDPSTWDVELQAFYKVLIYLRRTSPALMYGGFQVLLIENDTLMYQRDSDKETILVVVRRGTDPRPAGHVPVSHAAIPDGTEFTELFTRQHVSVLNGNFELPALPPGAQVWNSGKK